MSKLPPCRVKTKTFVQLSDAEQAVIEQDTAFLKAVEANNVEAVLKSERKDAADLNVADEMKSSAVHKASRLPDTRILDFLIENGACLLYTDAEGAQPVSLAIKYDNVHAMGKLLDAKAESGEYLVDLAQVSEASGDTLFHTAAWYDRLDCASLLIKTHEARGVPLNLSVPNKQGQTAVHVASFRSGVNFLSLLASVGGSLDALTSNPRHLKETPIDAALSMGKTENAQHLKDLQVAIRALRFAVKMRARRNRAAEAKRAKAAAETTAAAEKVDKAAEQAAGGEAPPSVLTLRFEGTLELFTADLEKAFIARLAKHAGVAEEALVVLSKTAGSVVLDVEVVAASPADVARAIATVDGASLDELSAALDVKMLSKSVRAKAKEAIAAEEERSRTPRATPGFSPMPQRANK